MMGRLSGQSATSECAPNRFGGGPSEERAPYTHADRPILPAGRWAEHITREFMSRISPDTSEPTPPEPSQIRSGDN